MLRPCKVRWQFLQARSARGVRRSCTRKPQPPRPHALAATHNQSTQLKHSSGIQRLRQTSSDWRKPQTRDGIKSQHHSTRAATVSLAETLSAATCSHSSSSQQLFHDRTRVSFNTQRHALSGADSSSLQTRRTRPLAFSRSPPSAQTRLLHTQARGLTTDALQEKAQTKQRREKRVPAPQNHDVSESVQDEETHAVLSVFDMFSIGIGPSSSHTVGPMRAAKMFVDRLSEDVLKQTKSVQCELFGSLACTGKGHGTPNAILMGLEYHDPDTVDPAHLEKRSKEIERTSRLKLKGKYEVHFSCAKSMIFRMTDTLPLHSNAMRLWCFSENGDMLACEDFYSIGGGFVIRGEHADDDNVNQFFMLNEHPEAEPEPQQIEAPPITTTEPLRNPDFPGTPPTPPGDLLDHDGASLGGFTTAQNPHTTQAAASAHLFEDGGSGAPNRAPISGATSNGQARQAPIVQQRTRVLETPPGVKDPGVPIPTPSEESGEHHQSEFSAHRHIDLAPPIHRFSNAKDLLRLCRAFDLPISGIVMDNEIQWRPKDLVVEKTMELWKVMDASIERGLKTRGVLPGNLNVSRRAPGLFKSISRLAEKTDHALHTFSTDDFAQDWLSCWAIAVNEENACGGRVVTAPTNGAAGVIPAVLRYYMKFAKKATDEDVVQFLHTAAAIGMLYKRGASISAAEVGCQGEVGVAASMAAAALCELMGGSPSQVANAAEIAMEHSLGLTCDPIGGLVQIPCIERNAIGANNAISSARLSLHGDGLHHVSLDNVIQTMRETGRDMQSKYKETALGGLAVNVPVC